MTMDGRTPALTVAAILVAAAVVAAALGVGRKQDKPAGEGAPTAARMMPDTLRDGLRRCQSLGEAALRDDGCARLWADQRDRFLGLKGPSVPLTGAPDASQSTDAAMRRGR